MGLQLALAHEAKGRPGEKAKEKGMSEWCADMMGPTAVQGKGNGQPMAQEADKQAIHIAKAHVVDTRYGQRAGPTVDQTDKQALAGPSNRAMKPEDGQQMAQAQVGANAKNAATGENDSHEAQPNMNQTVSNVKFQAMDQRNKTIFSAKDQATSQSKNQSIANTPNKAKSACKPQAKPPTNDQAVPGPKSQVISEGNIQDAHQGKDSENIEQSQTNNQSTGQAGGQEQVVAIPGAPINAQAAAAAASPTAFISNQQSTNGQSGRQSTDAHNGNDVATSNKIGSRLTLFSGVASAVTGGSAVGTAASRSILAASSIVPSGAAVCDKCQCNCPMAAFAMATQAAMMAPKAAAPPPRSTRQSMSMAKGDAQMTSTSAQQQALPRTTAPSTRINAAQAQAAQATNASSPQAKGGATAGGAVAALPTNLNTFSFQSAVTVPLGKRRETSATAALR
ncbi:MAG: hypothetical protein Q9191_002109 [Dirinaria sp. TL-2023a]